MDPADIATDTSDVATPNVVDPAVDGTEAGDAGDAGDGADAQRSPRSANKWNDLQDALGKFADGQLEPLTPPNPAEAVNAESDDADTPPKPDASRGEPRFTVIDAAGEALDADWPEGAKLRFKADGRAVEVTSFDQLVQMAQRASIADRLDVELSRRTQHYTRELTQRDDVIAARDQAIDESEATILAIAFDDAARARVQQALAPYRSPEAREGLKAKRELARREERDTAQAEQGAAQQQLHREQAITGFWDRVRSDIGAAIPEHEYLTEDDLDEVMDRFFRGYDTHRMELVERYTAEAARRGIPAERATEQAERDALTWITEENLAATLKGLNDRYAARAGRRSGTAPRRTPPGKPDPTPADDARRHNQHVDNKLRQSSTRVMRGNNGAPPAGNPAPARAHRTFKSGWTRSIPNLQRPARGRLTAAYLGSHTTDDSNILTAQFNRTKKFKAGPDGLYFNVKLETGGAVANVGDAIKLPHATHPKRRQGKRRSRTPTRWSRSAVSRSR